MLRLRCFTSGRDYRPGFFWGGTLSPNVVYARVLVVAETLQQGAGLLEDRGASLYLETLRGADPLDLPAAALLRYATGHFPEEPTAYLLVRADEDIDGVPFRAPRFRSFQLTPTGLHPIGRIRVVGMGRPTDPDPVAQLVPLDGRDDPVTMPEDREGPVPADNPVSTAVPYPAGRLGSAIREIEARLPRELAQIRNQLDELLGDLALSRRTADPSQACDRGAARLADVAQRLSRLQADAHLVEVVLHAGN